jgi:NAD(P)H-hydrate epimerase
MPRPILAAGIVICPSATGVALPVDRRGEIIAHEASRLIDAAVGESQCLVIGPGMGPGKGVQVASLRAVQQEDIPVVVDADALNALSEVPELWRDFKAAAVLTPHPGEYRRLAGSLGIKADPGRQPSRDDAAALLAQRLGCVVVLKGSGTVVSDGQRTWVNDTGGSELATAGTGDVLSGIIAALIAQFAGIARPSMPRPPGKPLDLFDAARLAVHAHGRAGELWTHKHGATAGLVALELAELVGKVLWPGGTAGER